MTKKELNQLLFLRREVDVLVNRIKELDTLVKHKTIDYTMTVKSTVPNDMLEELIDLKDLMEHRLEQTLDKVIEIENYIKDVDDCEMRTIMVLRFVKGYSWLKVSMAIGAYDEQYARKKLDRYLKKNDN